jgi:hypothetical protein
VHRAGQCTQVGRNLGLVPADASRADRRPGQTRGHQDQPHGQHEDRGRAAIPIPQAAIPIPQAAIPIPQAAISIPQPAIRTRQPAIRIPPAAIPIPQSVTAAFHVPATA